MELLLKSHDEKYQDSSSQIKSSKKHKINKKGGFRQTLESDTSAKDVGAEIAKPSENFKQLTKVKSHHSGWEIKKCAKYNIVD